MAVEKLTEQMTLKELKCELGKNDFGHVYPQGDVSTIKDIEDRLKKAGGKPNECDLDDFSKGGSGKGKPEFIITFNDDISTIIVIECKKNTSKHQSADLNKPKDYAVDGVLYYAKFLKKNYNVIAIAVSGTDILKKKVTAFDWRKGQDDYTQLERTNGVILEPVNYLKLIKGEKLQKEYSINEIRTTALELHEALRNIGVDERNKPIFIAGILIALNDDDFVNSYSHLVSFEMIINHIKIYIEKVLTSASISTNRIASITKTFNEFLDNSKLANIPLGQDYSIVWYTKQLELKIKPMMDYVDSTIDALGEFYHEFIKYTGSDKKALGIVLTPQHLTEFMCDVIEINKNSKVLDICCGTSSFLVTAMSKMFKEANPTEVENIRQNSLYGVEFNTVLYTLSIANMIIRKDGKSNIFLGDCFDESITNELKSKNINRGLINPPYSQKQNELTFTEHLLSILTQDGLAAVVVPVSCAIGNKFKEERQRLFENHTLKAVFSLPDEMFYPTATNTCVMVWRAKTPHNVDHEVFFGYYKDDGYVKKKKLGRIDASNKWEEIKKEWLTLYRNNDIKEGLSARKAVTHSDEWLCEAYMKTDYTTLKQDDFQQTINDYLSYLVKIGDAYES